jgi:hypothetical protein
MFRNRFSRTRVAHFFCLALLILFCTVLMTPGTINA